MKGWRKFHLQSCYMTGTSTRIYHMGSFERGPSSQEIMQVTQNDATGFTSLAWNDGPGLNGWPSPLAFASTRLQGRSCRASHGGLRPVKPPYGRQFVQSLWLELKLFGPVNPLQRCLPKLPNMARSALRRRMNRPLLDLSLASTP